MVGDQNNSFSMKYIISGGEIDSELAPKFRSQARGNLKGDV